jgi:hypothetical protein
MEITVWIVAAIIYLAFRIWYDGWRKPLTPEEVEHFSQIIGDRAERGLEAHDIAIVRKFMEEDDGREFIMVNLIEFNASPLVHPYTGEDVKARTLVMAYFKPFMSVMLRRAGHPVLSLVGVGGYLDAWNTPPDPGWHAVGLIRYRSRRDAIQIAFASPSFDVIHKFKVAALKQTFAFPAKTQVALYASPRLTVALLLALGASLLQLILM